MGATGAGFYVAVWGRGMPPPAFCAFEGGSRCVPAAFDVFDPTMNCEGVGLLAGSRTGCLLVEEDRPDEKSLLAKFIFASEALKYIKINLKSK